MEFLQGIAIFYATKVIIFFIFLISFLVLLCILRKDFKKKIAVKIINEITETKFFLLKVFVFIFSTVISLYFSTEYMQHIKTNLSNQYALTFSAIEIFRFSYQEYINFFPFLDIKEYLYKYISK